MEKDSNLRRRCQQIYSLPPLATRESIHKADKRTRTVNLLITNQLLCQLSHIGVFKPLKNGTNRARTCDPLLVRQVLSQLSYDPMGISLQAIYIQNDPEGTRTLDLRRDRAAL